MQITPRFNFTSEVPAPGDGGLNEDGALGSTAKGSPKEIQNRLDSKRWNEYERVMSAMAKGLGDFDFIETFPGLKLLNVSDAIRRLKAELAAALALFSGQNQEDNLDTRLYGIETGWASIGLNTLGTITGNFFTPGSDFTYEPSFEIIKTSTTALQILGGRISLPSELITVIPSLENNGAYEFDFPETEFVQNVDFIFGPGISLPAGTENKVEVINGRFSLPVQTLALDYLGKPLSTLTFGLGVGVKEFDYINISGTVSTPVSIVLVSGTVVNEYIDPNLPVGYYLGTDTFRSGDLEVIPTGYDVMVDPLSSSGKTTGLTDGTYYAYCMLPDTKGYFLGVGKSTGLLSIEEALITINGSAKAPANFFPLYFIKGDFNPVYSSTQSVLEQSRIYTFRRISNPLESSVNTTNTNDAIIDVRRFKSKPRPHIVPSWVPEGYLENSEIVRTDINGSEKKVLPLFIPLHLKHSKEQYTLEDIKGLTTPELEGITQLNHLYNIRFDYIYFPEASKEANRRKLGRLLTGSDSIYPDILGFFGKVKYNGTEYSNLTAIDSDLIIETEIISLDGTKIWKATSNDLSSIYSWTIDSDSRLSVTSLTEVAVSIKVNKELPYPIYLSEFQIVLSPKYTKISSTSAGSSYKQLYDSQIGKENKSEGIEILSDGTVRVTRRISPLENEIFNLEHYNSDNVINSSIYDLDLGLTARPLWWKVSTSLTNQYLLFYDGTNIKLTRINIADPRVFATSILDFPMLGSESFVLNNPTTEIYQGGISLEINIPERPKVTVVIKGTDYFKVMVASYYEDVTVTPEYETIYTTATIDTSIWKCLGVFRKYQNDFENAQISGNLDILDSKRIVFRNNTTIRIYELPAMVNLNFFGFFSKETPVIYEIPYESFYTTPDIFIAYVENFRNTQEFPKDASLEEAYCTLTIWNSVDDRFVTLTIKRDLTVTDPAEGSRVIFINSFSSDVLLTQPRFIRQCNGVEIGGYTLTDTELRVTYNPYTGEETRRATNLEYDRVDNFSIGTFLTLAETGRNSVSLNKDTGDIWSEDTVPSLVERYQDLNVLISSLVNAKGYSYRLNAFNSENNGLARMLTTQDKFLSVANLRTLPRSAVFVTDLGVARRAGRFTLSDKSEAFIFQRIEGTSERPSKYGVVLFTDEQSTSEDISSWPNKLPLTTREARIGGEDAEVLIELGSASGSVLDSGVWNTQEKLESFNAEFIHKNSSQADLYNLHTVKAALSHYPSNNEDIQDKEIVLPTDRDFIKYGDTNTNANTPLDNQVFLYMETGFDVGTVVDAITANPEATILELGYPQDPGYLYRTKFYKTGLVMQTNENAPATGILNVYIYDQYGLVSSAERTFYRSRTMMGTAGRELITIDNIGTLEANKKYTIKLSVKTGQVFSTVDTLKVSGGTRPEFAVRFIASNEAVNLTDSVWASDLSIKLGEDQIWTPAVKQLTNPWDLSLGVLAADRTLPFITQSREHGIVCSTDSGIKSVWFNTVSQWSELKVDDSGGLRAVYFDARATGQKILVTHTSTKLYVHNYVSGVWVRYEAYTFTNATRVEACISYDSNAVEVVAYDNGNLKYIRLTPWTLTNPGVISDTIGAFADITGLRIKGIPAEQVLIGMSRENGADVDIHAILGEAGVWDNQIVQSVPNSKFQIQVNQVTFFGSTPYIISSWKTSTTHYHVSVMKGVNYTGGGSLTWTENNVSFLSGIAATVTNTNPVFAFYAKPGYLVYAPDPTDYYLVEGFNTAESMLDPYYTRIRRSNKVTDLVEDNAGNLLWAGYFDARTDSLNAWSMYIPVPQNIITTSSLSTDPFGHNNWMFVDVQYSLVAFDNPFWNHLKIKHGVRFIDPVEDTIRSINSENSIYTDKVYMILDLVSKSRVVLVNDLRTLARKVAAGMFNDWDTVNTGANLALPTYRTLSKGDERMRLTIAYMGAGPALNKVYTITYDYSTDAGANYNTLSVETYAYDSNGYLVSTTWS